MAAEAPFVVERRTRSAGVAYHVRADFERVTTLYQRLQYFGRPGDFYWCRWRQLQSLLY